ncbi:MAG TPA: hypothetical protein VGL95_02130 [Acetobacteraceae bacterium]
MSITASFADLWSGIYVARVQDALGDTGATLTLNDTNPDSLAISGTATGLGLTILAKQQAALVKQQAATDRPQGNIDAITLSPAAQAKLRVLQTAAQLLATDVKPASDSAVAKSKGDNPVEQTTAQPSQPASNATGGQTIDPADVTALAAENPSQVIKEAVSAAQTALDDPASFYAAAANNSSIIQIITSGLSDSSKASFMAAYANQTLNLQNAADVTGWQFTGQTTITGTSESLGGGGAWGFAQPPANTDYTAVDFGLGQLFISWPKVA